MNNPPLLLSVPITENAEIAPKYFFMKLSSQELAKSVKAGQFFHVRVEDRLDIILRRPFSVFDFDNNSISILYEVVGKGTELLSRRRKGEELDILGPLGNGFNASPSAKKVIIIAGGMGVAPLFSLAKELRKNKDLDIQVLIGANNKYKILCEENFKRIGITPEIATDDGSSGHKGLVTSLLKEPLGAYIYACGPNNMLKTVANIIKENNLRGELSLDRCMGCGVGVCLGCVVMGADGKYKRVCKDGPVFRADELEWE